MPPLKLFISYSHKDKVWLERLVEHLGAAAHEVALELWDDRRIAIGDEWLEEITRAIDQAHAAVLLVSPSFLVSGFIRGVEVPRLLERRSKDGLRMFPVLIRSCDWQVTPWLSTLQIRPQGAKALAKLKGDDRDDAMAAITREIRSLLGQTTPPPQPVPPLPPATASTPPPALHQLPSPPADFTGREAELADLRQAVEQGGATISGVRGMGGVGKTTLALKLAEELRPSFPDAQIYLDLKGVSPEAERLSPAQAMAHVIRSFHPDAGLPENEAGLSALYRSVLDGKRALLLMDNAGSREQVEPLVPPKGCALLVTSRERFSLRGLVFKDLDTLPLPEACELLLRIEPRIGKDAAEIARLCGGLPLALWLAGSALADRPDLTPAAYLERLRANERLGFAEASLTLSYELLSEGLRKHWRELAVFPGTFDAAAAAAVWAVEADSADERLGRLVKSSLVDGEDGRYRLHDLARVFAESRLEKPEAAEARRRHAEHYAGVLAEANHLYLKGGESVLGGLRLFDLEWGNIQAGFAWAAERAEADEAAARLCNDYLDGTASCLDLRQPKRERIQWLDSALAAARRLDNRSAEGKHLCNLGNAYAELGDARRAIEYYEQALVLDREIGDRRGESQDLGNLGIAYTNLGDARRAIEHFEQVLQIAREIGDRHGEGKTFGNLGNAYADLGDAHRAIEHYEQHLQIAREIGDQAGEARASWNLGLRYEADGDLGRAAELMQRLVEYAREIGHQNAETWAAQVKAIRARPQEEESRPKKASRKRRGTSTQPRSGDRV